ncbi:hypothetical protein [Pseudogracilibacillus sp. ICA-222130]|uniref:hypothetical protein n=1 Tax=Pseudogracilibacillus sp. ICA-222130 TaxID=3134655 RepID=UPI0030BD3ECD
MKQIVPLLLLCCCILLIFVNFLAFLGVFPPIITLPLLFIAIYATLLAFLPTSTTKQTWMRTRKR